MTAWATVAIAGSTVLADRATCVLIWRGIREMHRSSDERTRAREAAAAELAEWRDADIGRHEEAMATFRALHAESMTALRTLIERTGPAAPAK